MEFLILICTIWFWCYIICAILYDIKQELRRLK